MKNEILDEPFNDSFSNLLEKGERIIWKKENLKKSLFSFSRILISFTLIGIFFYLRHKIDLIFNIVISSCWILFPYFYFEYKEKKKQLKNKICYYKKNEF